MCGTIKRLERDKSNSQAKQPLLGLLFLSVVAVVVVVVIVVVAVLDEDNFALIFTTILPKTVGKSCDNLKKTTEQTFFIKVLLKNT